MKPKKRQMLAARGVSLAVVDAVKKRKRWRRNPLPPGGWTAAALAALNKRYGR